MLALADRTLEMEHDMETLRNLLQDMDDLDALDERLAQGTEVFRFVNEHRDILNLSRTFREAVHRRLRICQSDVYRRASEFNDDMEQLLISTDRLNQLILANLFEEEGAEPIDPQEYPEAAQRILDILMKMKYITGAKTFMLETNSLYHYLVAAYGMW